MKQAIKQNDMELFLYLLNSDGSLAHEKFNRNFYTPLHLACEFGRLQMVKTLVQDQHVDINSICQLTGYTPVMYGCQVGQIECVRYLINQGADIMVKSHLSGRDALEISIEGNFDRVTDLINDTLYEIKRQQQEKSQMQQ